MLLTRLSVRNLRNLAAVDIYPANKLNILIGENASGKTSLLEAIYLLGMARTFRSQKSARLIAHGNDELTLFGQLSGTVDHRVGIKKRADHQNRIQLDGRVIKRSAELAALFPLQLITPESFRLITDGPNRRRAFIDWSLFHVEHQFHECWQRYSKLLKQRNTLLKSGQPKMLRHWDEGLIVAGENIDQLRKAFLSRFYSVVQPFIDDLLGGVELDFSYRQGWRSEWTFLQALEKAEQRDLKQGFTSVGPHRAELEIKHSGVPATDILSRGQQKLLVSAMKLAQITYLRQQTEKVCAVLVDDLPAELDRGNRERFLTRLYNLESQLFITTTDNQLIDPLISHEPKMFHVKHGQVEEVV